jgi:hypothetical protein
MVNLPQFESYGDYQSANYGVNALRFIDSKGNSFWFSYKTLVAFRSNATGRVVRQNEWGPTTGKHLNWIDGGNKADRLPENEFLARLAEVG